MAVRLTRAGAVRLAALALLALTLFAPAIGEAAGHMGTWYLHTLEIDGTAVNVADIGYRMTLTLSADGAYTAALADGQMVSGRWEARGGAIRLNPEADNGLTLVPGDGALTTELNGARAVFGRSEPRPTPVGGLKADARDADFFGEWTLSGMVSDGVYLPAVLYGISGVGIEFETEGVARYRHDGITEDLAWTFADDAFVVQSAADLMRFYALDDGTLMLRLGDDPPGGAAMIFTRA